MDMQETLIKKTVKWNCSSMIFQIMCVKVFLSYQKYRTQIESIIPDNCLYVFSAQSTNACQDTSVEKYSDSFYDMIDRRIEEFKTAWH